MTMTTRQFLWRGVMAAVPVVAIAIALLATRNAAPPVAAEDHSQHGGGPAATEAQPVMLSPDQANRIGVTYAVAEVTALPREIRTVGQVTYDETRVTTIALKVDGWVEALFVNFTGQAVASGTPLLAIYSPMLVAAQEELLLATQLERDVAGGTPDARASAASLVSSSRRKLGYWDIAPAEIERIERRGTVERTLTLRSPVTGFVVEKGVLQGQRVMAGDALYRIADLRTVWVEGEVFERDLPSVRLGQRVTAELDALPGEQLRGRITYVYPTLDPDTRTSRVRVELPNASLRLKPGMYATLLWQAAAQASGVGAALSVPRTAVLSTGQRHLVFVKRADGMLEPRLVRVGAAAGERVQILAGLVAGDSVVRSATFLVDAESNLGTLLGGMGDMPGMDMTAPTSGATTKAAPAKRDSGGHDAHANH